MLWSTNIHFGDFYFYNSAEIIDQINARFGCARNEEVGYFYGPCTEGRNNPEHPIIEMVVNGKESVNRILPKGLKDRNQWLPEKLKDVA